MLATRETFAPFENGVLGIMAEPGRMDELHLYHGARCNRTCGFCCVNGAPEGDHAPFGEESLQAAVATVARRGSLKIYGGEPTLDGANLRWTVRRLRELGFEGAITIFSNGLRAQLLIDLLEQDRELRVVLNRAIATGDGEEPILPGALTALTRFEYSHPGRIFLSHDFTVPVGRQAERGEVQAKVGLPVQTPRSDTHSRCCRCWPVLTSSGRYHACPFAVAYALPRYDLGEAGDDPSAVQERFRAFKTWIAEEVEPKSETIGRHVCEVCIEEAGR
jgi:hypothetical protein